MEIGPEYVTVGWYQWITGAIVLGGLSLAGFVFGFRSALGKKIDTTREDFETRLERHNETQFSRIDDMRKQMWSNDDANKAATVDLAKTFADALHQHELKNVREFATTDHMKDEFGRVYKQLEKISTTMEELLKEQRQAHKKAPA